MTKNPSEDPAEATSTPKKKRWEAPEFLSEEMLEMIAGVCGGVNPLGKESSGFCGAIAS